MLTTREKGQTVEEMVCQYLEQQGLQCIIKNYLSPMGEIDLIMQHGDTVAFIEVRYRSDPKFIDPLETITPTKQKKIIKTANHFLLKHYRHEMPCRFDVVAVRGDFQRPEIDWVKNAF